MIIFLYGSDDFRARRKIKALRDKFMADVDSTGSSFGAVDGRTASLETLSEAYSPRSLFSARRCIVIDRVLEHKRKEFISEFTEFLEREKGNDNILIVYEPNFIDKKTGGKTSVMKPGSDNRLSPLNKAEKKLFEILSASPFTQAFMPLPPAELATYLAALADEQGAGLSARAAPLLVRLVGTELWMLSNELAKLAAYANARAGQGAKPVISEADVREQVSQSVIDSIFSLTDALGNRQTGAALKLLSDQLSAGVHPHYILTMMLWQFKTLASVREALDNGVSGQKIQQALKLHPYVLEKSINQVRRFNLAALTGIIGGLVDLDQQHKTGRGNLEHSLPMMVARLS